MTEAGRLLYIGFWLIDFTIRRTVLTRVVPIVVIVLLLLELIGPILHVPSVFVHLGIRPGSTAGSVLDLFFLLIATTLVVHHRRLDKRIHRHRGLIGQMVVLLGQESIRDENLLYHQDHAVSALRVILDSFLLALKFKNNTFSYNAAVLVRDAPDGCFHIYAQDSANLFEAETIELDRQRSAAGCAATEAFGTLIYVPCARHLHGVKIAREQSRQQSGETQTTESFTTARPVTWLFQELDVPSRSSVNSLLCTKIPNDGDRDGSLESATCAVLCLSSPSPNVFGDLEFSAVRFFASLIFFALSRKKKGATAVA